MPASHTLIAAAVFCSLIVLCRGDLCAPDCSGGADFFPHPQDCNSYYQCSLGTPYRMQCPPSLVFSPVYLRCDYPSSARCTADPARECEGSLPAENPSTALPSQKPSTTAAQATQICAPKCLHEGLYLPHPQDCTKFYICGGGKVAFESRCQTGLYYNMKERRCDYPENVNCLASPERACDENLLD